MAATPYMQFYIADYLADTNGLTTLQHGAYLLLIMHYYQIGKSLDGKDSSLARICRTSVSKWLRLAPVLSEYFTIQNGRWYHKRIEDDLDRMAIKSGKSRDAANIRWGKHEKKNNDENNANAMRTQCERNANAMPSEQNRTEQNISEQNRPPNPQTPIVKKNKIPVTSSPEIDAVFNFWKKRMRHPNSHLDKKRKDFILSALKLGYTIEQLQEAIVGCSLTPHNMGKNDRGGTYDGLNVIFSSADNIDRFISNSKNPPTSKSYLNSKLEANKEAVDEWMNDGENFL